ncbi:MAG: ABC-type transport auxiliary lipoprotein family protein [Brevundimonas sp.]|uniref:ABC-type transport auxiliary lipoprotein family protein n=1 Tax=Brevundimonas sp. TaxID=1871086 RepID=UPI004034188E
MIRRFLIPVVAAGAVMALGGCALLSTPDPVQTYRFGGGTTPAAAVAPSPARTPIAVALRRVELPEASRGDRLLGVTGTEVSYIKGARWISSADVLLDDSLRAAFSAQPERIRLLGGRDVGRADRVLSLEVTAFEARYAAPGAIPEVVITARGRVTTLPARAVVEDRVFNIVQPAGANRISSIVEAFDIAVRDLNNQVVDWTETATPAG